MIKLAWYRNAQSYTFSLLSVFTATVLNCNGASAAENKALNVKPTASAVVKPASKTQTMLDGLLIKHYSWLGGDVEIAVTPKYLCISHPLRTGVTVSRAPFKTVTAYDSAKKTYYETTPEAAGSFMIQRFLKLLGGDPHPKKWKKVEEKTIAGVKAGRYVVDTGKGPPGKLSKETGEKVIQDMRVSGFWAAEDVNIPGGAADIVSRMEGFPTIQKLPLYFQLSQATLDKRPRVSTRSIVKAKFPLEKFQVPSGYRLSRAEYSLQNEEFELFSGGDPDLRRKKK
jgi:hypothetical protein